MGDWWNTPGQIGAGLSVCKAEGLTDHAQSLAQRLLSALGEVIWVEEERYMDMATALSGTGPAYVFIFMEALIDAGVHMGLPRHLAEKMVVATLRGSVRYYEVGQKSIATLRHEVTSPGGTTAEAMYRLEKAAFGRPSLEQSGQLTSVRYRLAQILLKGIDNRLVGPELPDSFLLDLAHPLAG